MVTESIWFPTSSSVRFAINARLHVLGAPKFSSCSLCVLFATAAMYVPPESEVAVLLQGALTRMCMSYVELSGSQRTHELVREQLGATAGCNSGVHGSFCKGGRLRPHGACGGRSIASAAPG